MNNILRYINGAIFGMCCEYLYRVTISIYPIIIMILIFIACIIDINLNRKNHENIY